MRLREVSLGTRGGTSCPSPPRNACFGASRSSGLPAAQRNRPQVHRLRTDLESTFPFERRAATDHAVFVSGADDAALGFRRWCAIEARAGSAMCRGGVSRRATSRAWGRHRSLGRAYLDHVRWGLDDHSSHRHAPPPTFRATRASLTIYFLVVTSGSCREAVRLRGDAMRTASASTGSRSAGMAAGWESRTISIRPATR